MGRLGIAPILLFGVLAACGGRTEKDGGDDPGNGGTAGGSAQGGSAQGGGAHGGKGGVGWGTTPLGECQPGVAFMAGKSCPWLADDICYPTREAACACDCPTDRESVCVESFSPVGEGEVDCY